MAVGVQSVGRPLLDVFNSFPKYSDTYATNSVYRPIISSLAITPFP